MPDLEIIKVIFSQTGKTITDRYLSTIRQQIKRESYHWYKTMREGEYEYLHEFKERINEIMDLQKKAHEIIDNNKNNPAIQLNAIAELHKLNVTLSNYFDVTPSISNGIINSALPESSKTTTRADQDIIV